MEFPSVNPLVIKNIITDASVPSVDLSVIIFFITNRFTDEQKIIDKRFTDGFFLSVISLVN
jgi:hypothetical protein